MRLGVNRESRHRLGMAALVALIHLLIAYVLLTGLGVDLPSALPDRLQLLRLDAPPRLPHSTPPPPARVKRDRIKPRKAEGAASPANLRDTPTEIVAPDPVIRLDPPPVLPAAPIAGLGNAPAAGAADKPGPGTGSGGQGEGTGSGTSGNGDGGGGGGGGGSDLRWLSGAIYTEDYPRGALRRGSTGTVGLRFIVGPNGRVRHCWVTRSSGDEDLDSVTCGLIRSRFRYSPARDASGKAIAATVTGAHIWQIGPEMPK